MGQANITILFAVVALTAGCAQEDPRVCGTLIQPPKVLPAATVIDQTKVVLSCVEQWSARLSPAPDDAKIVAEAAVSACLGSLEILAKMDQRKSLENGYPNSATLKRKALFTVVQTRAGKCDL